MERYVLFNIARDANLRFDSVERVVCKQIRFERIEKSLCAEIVN